MKKVTETVRELALPVVEEQGCKLWDVEYVREAGQWYLRIYIDKDGGVNILDCEAISRTLSRGCLLMSSRMCCCVVVRFIPTFVPSFIPTSSCGFRHRLSVLRISRSMNSTKGAQSARAELALMAS